MAGDWLTYSRQPRRRRIKTESNWSEVPPEILSLILSELYFKDRRNFKLVCRSWNSIVPNAPLLPPSIDSPYFHSPCLIFPQSSTNRWKIFHSVYNDFYYLEFPELKDAEIQFSKDGWLLMSSRHDESPLFFFNHLTKERFQLPPTNDAFYSVCFTSPPTSRDCFVFGIIRTFPGFATDFGLIKFGDEEWEVGSIANFRQREWFTRCPPLFYNGVYYCVNYDPSRKLSVFDPKKNGRHRWIPNHDVACLDEDEEDKEEEDTKIGFEYYIAQVEGEIWGVFVTSNSRKVSVRQWDSARSRWKKLESLGDKCLYVSRTGSFAETCGVSAMANKIFFNKFCGKSGVLYSLTTGMYHSIEGDFASKYAYGLTHMEHGSWIKMTTI